MNEHKETIRKIDAATEELKAWARDLRDRRRLELEADTERLRMQLDLDLAPIPLSRDERVALTALRRLVEDGLMGPEAA